MTKSVPPGSITIAGTPYITNAVPDPFDDRDFPYRPKLELLPDHIDPPEPAIRHVLHQTGESCTGHALATAINAVYARVAENKRDERNGDEPEWVSPYMLYYFGRRYDEFPGEADRGSSLRGTLKGWFHHGVCKEDEWDPEDPPDATSSKFLRGCRERPLGAYYRVNCYRLDDMQSAISELHAVVAAARVHDGWEKPRPYRPGERDGKTACVIHRAPGTRGTGGHAFAIVGYNRIGFVIQNSFGHDWGDGGFAILTYEDWLDSALGDAWVVRPGVPRTPFLTGRRRDEKATNAKLATGVGPDRRRLDRHVISLAEGGRLSTTGEFVSTPEQLKRIVDRMKEWHDAWSKEQAAEGTPSTASQARRHIVLYPQIELASDYSSLEAAQRHLNWWMNNRIYPIYLAWQTGPAEALLEELGQRVAGRMPPGGIGFDLAEQFDRLVEMSARRYCRWMWDQLKQNAGDVTGSSAEAERTSGALQLVTKLQKYAQTHEGECAVHLVGHGAGSIVLPALLHQLIQRELPVKSLTLLAPAIRMDDFVRQLRALPKRSIERLTVFALSPERELNDTCTAGGSRFYQKSLLYLVSRGLEAPAPRDDYSGEIPLLGMAKDFADPERQTRIEGKFPGAKFITAPRAAPPNERTDAIRHGDFEDDSFTMTSVVMRMLDSEKVDPFRANTRLYGLGHVPGQEGVVVPAGRIADTQPPDSPPLVTTAEARTDVPRVPPCHDGSDPPEIGEAPANGDPTAETLRLDGYVLLLSGSKTSSDRSHVRTGR